MEIKTVFDVYQKVWFMCNNKCDNLPITGISVTVEGKYSPCICYYFQTEDGTISVYEGKVFATKEELINSL